MTHVNIRFFSNLVTFPRFFQPRNTLREEIYASVVALPSNRWRRPKHAATHKTKPSGGRRATGSLRPTWISALSTDIERSIWPRWSSIDIENEENLQHSCEFRLFSWRIRWFLSYFLRWRWRFESVRSTGVFCDQRAASVLIGIWITNKVSNICLTV